MGAWLGVLVWCSTCPWLGELLGDYQQHPCPAHGIMLEWHYAGHKTGIFGKLDISKAHTWKCGSFACGDVTIAKPLEPPVGHGGGAETPQFLVPTLNSRCSCKPTAVPDTTAAPICHYPACLSHEGAARNNCDAEFCHDCSFLYKLHGLSSPSKVLPLCSPPRASSLYECSPLGQRKEIPVATTPGYEGTSPIWVWLITCKAPALFMENPFRKSWELDNKFAVGWRGEAGVLTGMCVLAGFLCTLAGFTCCRL